MNSTARLRNVLKHVGTGARGNGRTWLLVAALALLGVPAFLPLATEGLPRAFDSVVHLLRIGRLSDLVGAGFLFPRWTPELQLGLGYPLFSYYAPASYYLVAALHGVGLSFYNAFAWSFVGLALLGATGMLLWARALFGVERPGAAFAAAVAYLYSPYLLTNVYTRGAVAEVGALALLPWIFWSARGVLTAREPARFLLPLAFSLGGLALTHNITLLFVPPVLLGYIVVLLLRTDDRWRRGGWIAGGLALAMGVSAFFWLPLVGERGFLSDYAYTIAKTVWLPRSVWRWDNVLDPGVFDYTAARPVRIGLVQLLLGAGGFVLARRRDGEWLYLGAVAVALMLLGGAWALPLWLSNDILPIAQFPWRMLSVIALILCLFTGGIVLPFGRGRPAWGVTGVVIAVTIWAHAPRLHNPDVFAAAAVDVAAPVAVQIEADAQLDEGAPGNSLMHEYRPRWAPRALSYTPAVDESAPPLEVTLQRANLLELDAEITSATGGPLRLHTFYFPGWRVTLDGQALTPYPSTNLALLTVDVPAGAHDLSVRWAGTRLQQVAGWLTLAALLVLAGVVWRTRRRRWLIVAPLAFAAWGVLALVTTPRLYAVDAPPTPVTADGLALRGVRTALAADGRLHIYPFWYVTATPARPLVAHWTLQRAGEPVATSASTPIFNAATATDWPPGTLVDDAYRLPLPDALPAGTYELALAVAADDAPVPAAVVVGQVTLAEDVRTGELPTPAQPVDARFGDAARLTGYDLTVRRARPTRLPDGTPAVPAGAYLDYALQWQADARMAANYHTFVHLVDRLGRPVAQEDHLPGPSFRPPALWSAQQREPDVFRLRVPRETPGGLYWPAVGMYEFRTQDRLEIVAAGSDQPVDALRLGPVKIVGAEQPDPAVALTARVGEMAHVRGYTLDPAQTTFAPGDAVTVTLHVQADRTGNGDYTRFLQLYAPALGMAAQADGVPVDGINPMWSWVEGEAIADTVTLTIAPDAAPGVYTLYTGFYDPADGARVPLFDQDDAPLPDNWLPLTQITVR